MKKKVGKKKAVPKVPMRLKKYLEMLDGLEKILKQHHRRKS